MKKLNIVDKIIIPEDEIKLITARIYTKLYDYYKDNNVKEVSVIVVLQGASIFALDLFPRKKKKSNINFNLFFVKAESYNKTKQNEEIIIDIGEEIIPEDDITNKHILIIDDIYDSGNTLDSLINEINKYNPASLECCVFIERNIAHTKNVDIKFIGKKIDEEKFLIGYGLDYEGKYRELPYICTFNDKIEYEELCPKILCNSCGESCEIELFPGEKEQYGLIDCRVRGGYSSSYLEDGILYRFDICEKCLKNIFDNFKIPVSTVEYDLFDGTPFGEI